MKFPTIKIIPEAKWVKKMIEKNADSVYLYLDIAKFFFTLRRYCRSKNV